MEENQPKTGKIALKYGLFLGGASVIFAFMLYLADMHYQAGTPVFIISVVLMLAAIIIGMIQFKKENNGFITFGQGFKIGVGICLIAGVIGVIFNQLMVNVIDPDMMEKAMEFQKATLMESGDLTPEQINAQIEMGKNFTTPTMQIAFGLLGSVFMGLILSLIPALVIKKTKPE